MALADAKDAAASFGILNATTVASNANVARTVAQFQPTIPAYAAAADGLKITVDELYLVCQYCLPVHGTVPRPLSSQFVYDNITLLQEPIDVTKPLLKQITIPVNTTRIIIGFRDSDKDLTVNRELLGKMGGLLSNSTGLNELGYRHTPATLAGNKSSNLLDPNRGRKGYSGLL